MKLLVFVLLVASAVCVKLPSNFKQCKQNDPNFAKCLEQAAEDAIHKLRNGSPELGLLPLDPLEVKRLEIKPTKGQAINFGLTFENIKIYGISDSKLSNQRADLKNFALNANALTPEIRFEGDYEVNGQVLLLPIEGKGKCNITLRDVKSTVSQTGEHFQKDGKTYVKINKFDYRMNPGYMHITFDNLFNGDPVLGANMNQVLNENWKDVMRDIQPGIEEGLSQVFLQISNRIFLRIPKNEIFL